MSQHQASRFADAWTVVDTYQHVNDPYPIYDPNTGEFLGNFSGTNGLSATIFRNIQTGEVVLSVRGTNDVNDILADIEVAALGEPPRQGQYQSLRQRMLQWIRDEKLPTQFAVTGHSLGGFLATGLALEFPQYVTHAYAYNAPGLGGLTNRPVIDTIAQVYHITGGAYDPTHFTNVRTRPGNSVIAGLGNQPAPPILIENEDHGLIGNHSIVPLTDSLALYDAFGGLSSTDAIGAIGAIVRGTYSNANATLETALDALRRSVLGPATTSTTIENRDAFHANLIALRDSGAYQALVGRTRLDPIATLSAEALAHDAHQSLGSLVALQYLAPFRLAGADPQLAAQHVALQSSLNHDQLLPTTEREVDADYTSRWLAERARFVGVLTARARAGVDLSIVARNTFADSYTDLATDIRTSSRLESSYAQPRTRVVFGRQDAANTIAATGPSTVFGGFANDTITGSAGRDVIEGNRGTDTLVGGGGRDTLIGGEGTDVLDGGADIDYLYGGAGVDSLIAGSHDDVLDGGRDNDTLRGDAGVDTYLIRAGHGRDTITDSDGQGRIVQIDATGRSTVLAGVGLADRAAPNRWSVFVRNAIEFVASRNSPLTLTTADGTQVVVSEHASGQLGVTLLADFPDEATTHTITGDHNADQRDTLIGTGVNDLIDGGADTDSLFGGIGADHLLGGAGRDRLEGESGDDVLEGGAEGDILEGGDGRDRLFADSTTTFDPLAAIRAALASVAEPTGDRGDWLSGGGAEDVLIGAAGNDGLAGGAGTDVLVGGAGDDSLLGDVEASAATGDWGWSDTESDGLLARTFTGMDGGALDPVGGASDSLLGGAGNDFAMGGRGDDAIDGGDGADFLQGDAGSDAISGGAGDDRLVGDGSQTTSGPDQGHDWLSGDDGADMLIGGGSADDLLGGDGDDTLFGDDALARLAAEYHGDDRIDAGAGADRIEGGLGSDVIDGGDGDDWIQGDIVDSLAGGDDEIAAGTGNDVVDAGSGDDRVDGGLGDDAIDGGDGDDDLRGGDGTDLLQGSAGMDSLEGGADADRLWGGDDDDGLDGGDGDDSLFGGDGADLLMGSTGNDDLHGDAGADDLVGEDGFDYLDGGEGDDRLNGGLSTDVVAGGAGNDTLDGEEGSDLLLGGGGADRFLVGTGSGVDFLADLELADVIVLPDGVTIDDLDFQRARDENGRDSHLAILAGNSLLAVALEAGSGVRPAVQLASGTLISNSTIDNAIAGHPTLQVEIRLPSYSAIGSASADRIVSAGGALVALGEDGDDDLQGGRAADDLRGGNGADRISSGAGDDLVAGDAGNDVLDAGDGDDSLDGGDGEDVLTAGIGDDQMQGGAGQDTLRGDAGADTLAGGEGDDTLDGGEGRDTLAGEAGADSLDGGAGNDSLDGGDGDDLLVAGAGNDTLTGGAGNDRLDGGAGDDTFVVDGRGTDRIVDAGGASVVRFGAGITPTSFTLTRGAPGSADENALIVDFGGGNRTVIEDGLRGGPSRYDFADGSSLTRAQFLDRRYAAALTLSADVTHRQVAGGSASDTLSAGTATHADLRGGGGNDTLTGAGGADRLSGDDGDDTIAGLAGVDTIDGGAGNDALDGGDGDDIVAGGAGNDVLAGGIGADTVIGGDGNDVYASDAGDDFLHDSGGDDTYRFGAGAGYDQIVDTAGANRVRFAAGIAEADVSFRTDGTHLVAALADGSRLYLGRAVTPSADFPSTRVDGFDFDAGSITLAQAIARATPMISGDWPTGSAPSIGTAGDDTLGGATSLGLGGNDTIRGGTRQIGGPGDDYLERGRTIVFGRGDGHDTVQLYNSASRRTVGTLLSWIEMGPGVTASDLALGVDGRDLLVTIRDTGDSIRVTDNFDRVGSFPTYEYEFAVAGIRFADGSTLDFNAILDGIGVGSDGDDRIGSASVVWDTINAGDGDDVVTLIETSADVFGGDGDDTLSADPYLPLDGSRLHGGAGNDRLTASSANSSRTELYGEEGDDRLIGHPGARLDGGTGDDRYELFSGATGGPIGVAFGRGQGHDSIAYGEEFNGGGSGHRFDIRVSQNSYRDLVVEREGDDLVLSIRDRDDRIAVPDFFASGSNRGGMVSLAIVDPATGLVYGDSPTAEEIAARAVTVDGAGETWTGTSTAEVRVATGFADTLNGGGGDDELDGMSGDDTLAGGDGADTLIGRSGQDTLDGGAGDDRLSGGRGDDVLVGGDGDDRIVDSFGENIVEGGAGDDSVHLAGERGLALGGDGDDTLYAPSGDHLLVGGEGADTLTAGRVRVELDGGAGDDRLDLLAPQSAIVHFGRGAGHDTVALAGFSADAIDEIRMAPGVAAADVTLRRSGTTLLLTLAGGADSMSVSNALAGDAIAIGRITFADGSSLDAAALLALARVGSDLADELVGTTGDDLIAGGGGDDTIDGLAGNDTLDGGGGADTMRGGTGNDIYVVDDPLDQVLENAAEGVDEVRSSLTFIAPANVERLRLTGTAAIDAYGSSGDDDIGGNVANNTLYASTGADRLAGGAGDDSYWLSDGGDTIIELAGEGRDTVMAAFGATLEANLEDLVLVTAADVDGAGNALDNAITGGDGVNVLTGLAGNDTLDGGLGADRLVGGSGDDTYVVDQAGDVVVELAGEGSDTIVSSIAYVLPADIENLVLAGSANLAATGNDAANRITGNGGANTIDGRGGADTMAGGRGNDTYVVDVAGDIVTENASEGTDLVQSSIGWTLSANLEHLTLTGLAAISGTGNTLANTMVGNAAANVLDGGAGNDTMRGGGGDDTYVVDASGDVVTENAAEGTDTVRSGVTHTLGANVERLVLTGTAAINGTGNTLANTLTGNTAANVLNGGAGGDTMAGGAGNDTYVVDATGDIVTENAGEGTDLVQSSIAWTLGAELENLTLTGTAAINGTGNALANVLVGNAAANLLNGGAGNDTTRGGAGNDTYVVDAAGDVVTENAAEGTDLVQASVGWTLSTNVENLTLTGTAAINGTGNTLANTLIGNSAANVLNGGSGADAMSGGAGDDTYVVDNIADTTTEGAGGGLDRVQSGIGWTLGANLEDLTLTGSTAINGTGNTLANELVGNAAINTLSGMDGNDLLFGAAGDDTLAGGLGDDLLQGGDGIDAITDTAGNNLFDGGLGNDALTGAAGREILIGGKGDDTIDAGTGADILAFNRGDGRDTLLAAAGADDTLSLGGGIRYADLGLRKIGNDLVLDAGVDQITFKDWYAAAANHRISTLQMVVDASTDYLSGSTDPLRNRRIAQFDFARIASDFDTALAANPALGRWTLGGALAGAWRSGSDTAALGGDLAYQFGRNGTLSAIGDSAAATLLGDANFALASQAFLAPAALSAGAHRLR
ncbi:MAG: calcium-binding protein [Burkholderiales bacterium]